jgi:hypothetical protein
MSMEMPPLNQVKQRALHILMGRKIPIHMKRVATPLEQTQRLEPLPQVLENMSGKRLLMVQLLTLKALPIRPQGIL